MYKLKDSSKNLTLPVEITDSDYEDLFFWKKWKYEYFTPSFTKISPVNSKPYSKSYQNPPVYTPQPTVINNYNDDDSLLTGIVTGVVINELLSSDNQQINSVDYNDQQIPQVSEPTEDHSGNGGDFGGGGSSGSWANDSDSQQSDTFTPDNSNDSYSDSNSNDSYSDTSTSSDSY